MTLLSTLDALDELRLKTQQFPHDDALERRYVDELDCAYVLMSLALRAAVRWLEASDDFDACRNGQDPESAREKFRKLLGEM